MKNLKRIAASIVAATAIVSSVAVTASADYKASGVNGESGKYLLRIAGLPEQISNDPQNHPVILLQMRIPLFTSAGEYISMTFSINNESKEGTCMLYIGKEKTGDYPCKLVTIDGELALSTEFPSNDEVLAGFILTEKVFVGPSIAGNLTNREFDYYAADGTALSETDADKYHEEIEVTWEPIHIGVPSESTTSEPTSEPVSEPTSTPVSEPTSSAPESTAPESSETSKPSEEKPNPTTGVGSIAFAVAAAAIAGGAVIVARRKK